ncbi:HIT family protein [Candidatus Paracaedibacter acanthamoebae]|uniref:HIT family protein n=1 Tax=Candidatus Odyssella acanthamoebae TaxID=91604 RepID=UPI00068B66D6
MSVTLSQSSESESKKADPCIFCDIVAGSSPCFKIWESESHLAFLSIFPNTQGATVVIPKKHFSSYAFEVPEEDFNALMKAAREVGLLLDKKLLDVGRTGMVLEGFGINHVHAKLFPLHGTATEGVWKPIKSSVRTYFNTYQGYISSHDSQRADDFELAALAEHIRQ